MDTFAYFVSFVLPLVVFFMGQFGNILGILVMLRKSLSKIGPQHMYRYMFIVDSLYLLVLLKSYFAISFRVSLFILRYYLVYFKGRTVKIENLKMSSFRY